MDMTSAFGNINWVSVLLAALSTFLIGGIWYGPLFGKVWLKENGFTEEELAKRNMPKTFGGSFLFAFIASLNLEMFIGTEATLSYGAIAGLLAGVGWVSTFLGIIYLFEDKSIKLFFISAGYCTISLTIMGAVLGAW